MLIEDFLTYLRCERCLSVRTVASYSEDLYQWADFATGGKIDEFHPQDATTNDIRQWIASLAARGLAPRSIHRKASALCSFFRFMMKRHALRTNPAADLVLAKIPKPLPTVIPEAQMMEVLDSEYDTSDFIDVRNHLIVNLLYQTGIRVSELTGLLDCNVSTTAASIRVLGKRNKERIIPIGPELLSEIALYRGLRNQHCPKHLQQFVCFFVKADGSGIEKRTVYSIVRAALDGKVTASKRSPHVLRHSFATDMLNHGADLNSVKSLLGHQSLETTQIYTHISLSEIKHNYELAHPRAQKKGGNHGS